jgi:hypothetical protein
VVTSYSFCDAFKCCSFGSDFEIMNGHTVEKKLTVSEKGKIIQEVEKTPTVLKNEIMKCSVLPPSYLRNTVLWNSILEENDWCMAL